MDTVKFIDERNRMCRSFAVACHDAENKRCPAFKVNKDGLLCAVGRESTMDAKDQIAIVESWSAAHPVKTRQSAFLEQWPNAEIDCQGVIAIDPCDLDKTMHGPSGDCYHADCDECRLDFWQKEVD